MFVYNNREVTNKRSYLEAILVKKYIGHIVEIIYMDRAGMITQRQIKIHDVRGELVRATCMKKGVPRAFRVDRILACFPVKTRGHHVS